MLPQTDAFHQSSNQILMAMKELQIGRLLRQANIRKACGIPVLELFHVLVLLVFHGKNLFRFLHSEHNSCTISKNAFYRFLENPSFNWHRFLLLLAARITKVFRSLTVVGSECPESSTVSLGKVRMRFVTLIINVSLSLP